MKKMLLFITVFTTIVCNSLVHARAEFCKTITDQFGKLDQLTGVNLAGVVTPDYPSPRSTKKEIVAWLKEFIGGVSVKGSDFKPKGSIEIIPGVIRINVFKDVICPTIKNELNKRHALERYEEDPTLICQKLPSLIKTFSNTIIEKLITQVKKLKLPSSLVDTAKNTMIKILGFIIGVLQSDVVQGLCTTAFSSLHEKDFTPEELVIPNFSIPIEVETDTTKVTPTPMPVPPTPMVVETMPEDYTIVTRNRALAAEDIRNVVRKEATKIVTENPQLTPQEQKEVTSAIVEAVQEDISTLGIPDAPPIGDLEETISKTIASPSIKIIPAAKKPVREEVKQEAKADLMGALKAAMAKRREDLGNGR